MGGAGSPRRWLEAPREVEAGLESKAALDALVADYLAKAKRIG